MTPAADVRKECTQPCSRGLCNGTKDACEPVMGPPRTEALHEVDDGLFRPGIDSIPSFEVTAMLHNRQEQIGFGAPAKCGADVETAHGFDLGT